MGDCIFYSRYNFATFNCPDTGGMVLFLGSIRRWWWHDSVVKGGVCSSEQG